MAIGPFPAALGGSAISIQAAGQHQTLYNQIVESVCDGPSLTK